MPLFEQIQEKYADRDVQVLHLYVREPHPDERSFHGYYQPKTYDTKMKYAKDLVEKKGITTPVLVDAMDEKNHEAMGRLPNMAYVIGKNGNVYYKADWADADKIDKALAELVTADDPSRPVEPSFDTQSVGAGI